MKIYLVGFKANTKKKYKKLYSYWYITQNTKHLGDQFKKDLEEGYEIFLDSGAFTAWKQGVEIDIYKYIDFIKQHPQIKVYSNLDVVSKSFIDKRSAAEQSKANMDIMEKAGLKPLAVFHYGEPLEYLKYYIEKYDYIALGGMVGESTKHILPWIDACFEYICNKDGSPKVKIHSFGMTSVTLLNKFPFYSADSSSWLNSVYGKIPIPKQRKGEWDYSLVPLELSVSSQKDTGLNLKNLYGYKRDLIIGYIKSRGYKMGKSEIITVGDDYELQENERFIRHYKGPGKKVDRVIEKGIVNDTDLRAAFYADYFESLENWYNEHPVKYRFQKKKMRPLFWGFDEEIEINVGGVNENQ